MSDAARTEELVRELRDELTPVRPIPRLRWVAGVAVVLGALSALLVLGGGMPRRDLPELVTSHPGYAAILLGLLLAAGGGILGAVGGGVPGREAVERAGRALLAAGALLGLLLGPVLLLLSAGSEAAPGLAADWMCLRNAGLIGLAPAAVIAWFLARAAPFRPGFAIAVGVAGAVALGALVVHASCPYTGVRHWLVGHALAPIVALLVLAPPLGWWLARRRAAAGA